MSATRKMSFFVSLLSVVLVLSTPLAALGAPFAFSNGLNIRMSITMTYVDADSGALTTRGWWHVEPGGETVVNVDADLSKGVYYAAYNKGQYYDSSTDGDAQIGRWASPRTFTYTTDEKPYDDGVWYGAYYMINGRSVHIDTSVAPRGGPLERRENSGRAESYTQASTTRPSVDRPALGAAGREALGDRLSREILSSEELAANSEETLAYLRNRIYANHGYVFKTKQWSEEFSRVDWYRPNPNFSEQLFNAYERENLRRIMAEEKRK